MADASGPAAARSGRESSLQPLRKEEATTQRANLAELGGDSGDSLLSRISLGPCHFIRSLK